MLKKLVCFNCITSIILCSSCSMGRSGLFYNELPEKAARAKAALNYNERYPLDIVYYSRSSAMLYTNRKYTGMNITTLEDVKKRDYGFYKLVTCRSNKNCDSDEFKDCSYISEPSNSNSEEVAIKTYKYLLKNGYPVFSVKFRQDTHLNKTIEVQYYTECASVAGDVKNMIG